MNSSEAKTKSIASKLAAIAREENVAYEDILTKFLLERLLARLIHHRELHEKLIFKGGYVALRVYDSPRFTVDLDAVLKNGTPSDVIQKTKVALEADLADGVWFKYESQIDLKTQGEYGGIRLNLRCGLGPILKNIKKAQIVHLDIGIGDPIHPAPLETSLHSMINHDELSCLVYPSETASAEKLHTLCTRGPANSRSKDVYDLHLFLKKVDEKEFKIALKKTAAYRSEALPENLSSYLGEMDINLLKRGWAAAIKSIIVPPSFEKAFSEIIAALQRMKI